MRPRVLPNPVDVITIGFVEKRELVGDIATTAINSFVIAGPAVAR
jgi:hypothetical protein